MCYNDGEEGGRAEGENSSDGAAAPRTAFSSGTYHEYREDNMEKLKKNLFHLAIWASVLVSYLAFAVVGGFCMVKSDREDLKNTCKKALAIALIFFVAELFLTIFNEIGGMCNGYYGSGAFSFYTIASGILEIVKIVTVVVFAVLGIVGVGEKKEKNGGSEKENTAEAKAPEAKN